MVRYKARKTNGRLVRGRMIVAEPAQAKRLLKALELNDHNLSFKQLSAKQQRRYRLSSKQLTIFTEQLSVLLQTGIALDKSLRLLQQGSTELAVQLVICRLIFYVSSGLPLSNSLSYADAGFAGTFHDLIAAAERHGNLAGTLAQLAELRKNQQQVRSRVIKAMLYPSIVLCVSAVVCYLMLTRVVPEFEAMFQSFGSELPAFTVWVLALSDWFEKHALKTATLIGIIVTAIKLACRRSSKLGLIQDALLLKLPIIGPALHLAALSRYCRTLSTLLSSGVALLDSLHRATPSDNRYVKQQFAQAHLPLHNGQSYASCIKRCELVDSTTAQLIEVGEHSGQLPEMLLRAADRLDQKLTRNVDNLGEIIEPVMIVMLGGLVGGLVIAMYLPIISLMGNLH